MAGEQGDAAAEGTAGEKGSGTAAAERQNG